MDGTHGTPERSRCESASLRCPDCGVEFETAVWLVVDRSERPDLVELLLQDRINAAACPHCGAAGSVNHPLLLHDGERQEVWCALPLSVMGERAARELVGDLLRSLVASLPPEQRGSYLGAVEIVAELDGLRAALMAQMEAEQDEAHELAAALQELLNVAGRQDFQRAIASHRRVLMSERAMRALDDVHREAREARDPELLRRVREAQAILGRMRGIVAARRRTLLALVEEVASIRTEDAALVPALRRVVEAVDPQEVYAVRIGLGEEQQAALDRMIERLVAAADVQGDAEALAFIRHVHALPRQ